ncbi:hypothetical protein [Neisseria sp. Ec49-e6-T10]|uniref:hypothetical protein n=1 Tax=Neisseria sp. Ec49-e6-T10 TaxID=3140744 RepID=UPI003EBE2D93
MFKKVIPLLLVYLLGLNQFVFAQEKQTPQLSIRTIGNLRFVSGTDEQEKQLDELIEECFTLMGYKHRVLRDSKPSYTHPLYPHVQICSRYGRTPKDRIWFDKDILGDSFTSQKITTTEEVDKQLEEVYKKLYLVIRQAGLLDALRPKTPYSFAQEFSKSTGLMDYLNKYLKQNNYNFEQIEEEQYKFFGSKEKMEQAQSAFYEEKMREYGIGEK